MHRFILPAVVVTSLALACGWLGAGCAAGDSANGAANSEGVGPSGAGGSGGAGGASASGSGVGGKGGSGSGGKSASSSSKASASSSGAGGSGGAGGGACVPEPELCDGIDNNCDGVVDEGCACINKQTQDCYTANPATKGIGICKTGLQTCNLYGAWSMCVGEIDPAPAEICNGLDDDCNGTVDDGLGTTTCGVGDCTVTTPNCVQGAPATCMALRPASPVDLCDGTDNNCNGMIDDGCSCIVGTSQSCYGGSPVTLNVGVCKGGIETCAAGGMWGPCVGQVLPSPETCNGFDDDCNAQIDDTLGTSVCGVGACQATAANCVAGMPNLCVPGQPTAETCNGIDDDCNNLVDDGLGTITCGLGQCLNIVPACKNGQDNVCNPGVPSPEACDGKDNNCNGVIDDGDPGGGGVCSSGQQGVCAAGTQHCVSGSLSCVQNAQPSPEVCDGKDNDCNGQTDDGNPGGGSACNTGKLGVCTAGTTSCIAGAISCVQTTQSSAEICDGLDNNCNGATDEGNPGGNLSCDTGKLGLCSAGTTACVSGSIACNENVPPAPELCDGKDNNCNGQTDEGNPESGAVCTTGKPGVCSAGTTTCNSGSLDCVQSVQPSGEICDGKDNDCDGAVDNGNPGGGVACNTGKLGVCAAGTTSCVGGAIVCNQNVQPSAETCDGQDNNCNGAVDEGNPGSGAACNTGKLGVCSAGTTTCQAGAITCAQTTQPSAEICDGKDNDCDGAVDNGNPGGGASCGTGKLGVCSAGTTACTAGAIACNQNVQPAPEVCDGKDNDCDGVVDNGNPGGGTSCNTGLSGVCGAGTTACGGGAIICNQNVQPSPEVCDGVDNNCNGQVDEGNPGGGTSCNTGKLGVCAPGTTACGGGVIVCNQNTQPSAETCDGQDNNCNGQVDEGNPGGNQACSTGKLGICAGGTTACTAGAIKCNQNNQPTAEICNALDDDCNGVVDNGNPGGGVACNTGLLGVCAAGTTACTGGADVCAENVLPSAEICDGLDNNCNGTVDEGVTTTYYRDADGDGFGNPGLTTQACSKPAGYVTNNTDCNDANAAVHPGAVEVCNGIDDNCNGSIDEGNPGGGVACSTGLQGVCSAGTTSCTAGAIKCNENTAASAETCDGKDNNCDGQIDNNVVIPDGIPNNCSQAVNKTVTVAAGFAADVAGYIDTSGDDWFEVTFSGVGGVGTYYHPVIDLTGNGGGQFKINVFTSCGSAAACSETLDTFEMSYPNNPNACQSFANCLDNTPKVVTWIVQVTRVAGAPFDCTQYNVHLSNI